MLSQEFWYQDDLNAAREEGIVQGITQGIDKNRFDTALLGLRSRFPLKYITTLTGYSVEGLKKLAQENNIDYDFTSGDFDRVKLS